MNSNSFRVRGVIPAGEFELAVARWYAYGMAGCEESAIDKETTAVAVYFSDGKIARRVAGELRHIAAGREVVCEPVVNEDWNARWRETMQPARLADHWWVSPVWLEPPLKPGDHWIKIEPKMAFGTGHHETTRLAAREIIGRGTRLEGNAVLDVGTGSGVLCFTAAMLGARLCIGVEIDADCRENLAENLRENGCDTRCSFVIGSLDALCGRQRFGVVIMNMIHTESAPLLGRCRELIAADGVLVWSGILCDEFERAVQTAEEAGFIPDGQTRENEWWCGRFRPAGG
ncbi:MAG: 50S ribosomal protein L11 methyltransferase [Chitinispirillaceae bacterium]|nr:50S ribosomal protein L11 methyltransferase [Chitinispirillaceae bacterium]